MVHFIVCYVGQNDFHLLIIGGFHNLLIYLNGFKFGRDAELYGAQNFRLG